MNFYKLELALRGITGSRNVVDDFNRLLNFSIASIQIERPEDIEWYTKGDEAKQLRSKKQAMLIYHILEKVAVLRENDTVNQRVVDEYEKVAKLALLEPEVRQEFFLIQRDNLFKKLKDNPIRNRDDASYHDLIEGSGKGSVAGIFSHADGLLHEDNRGYRRFQDFFVEYFDRLLNTDFRDPELPLILEHKEALLKIIMDQAKRYNDYDMISLCEKDSYYTLYLRLQLDLVELETALGRNEKYLELDDALGRLWNDSDYNNLEDLIKLVSILQNTYETLEDNEQENNLKDIINRYINTIAKMETVEIKRVIEERGVFKNSLKFVYNVFVKADDIKLSYNKQFEVTTQRSLKTKASTLINKLAPRDGEPARDPRFLYCLKPDEKRELNVLIEELFEVSKAEKNNSCTTKSSLAKTADELLYNKVNGAKYIFPCNGQSRFKQLELKYKAGEMGLTLIKELDKNYRKSSLFAYFDKKNNLDEARALKTDISDFIANQRLSHEQRSESISSRILRDYQAIANKRNSNGYLSSLNGGYIKILEKTMLKFKRAMTLKTRVKFLALQLEVEVQRYKEKTLTPGTGKRNWADFIVNKIKTIANELDRGADPKLVLEKIVRGLMEEEFLLTLHDKPIYAGFITFGSHHLHDLVLGIVKQANDLLSPEYHDYVKDMQKQAKLARSRDESISGEEYAERNVGAEFQRQWA